MVEAESGSLPNASGPADTGPTGITGHTGITMAYLRQPGYLDDLASRSLEWIRAERAAVTDLETGISYARRLLQGHLDIVGAELRRRLEGGDRDLASLVDDLPEILAGNVRAPGTGRLSSVLSPGPLDPDLVAEMADAAPDAVLGHVIEVDDADLALTEERLTRLEADVSMRRRACFAALDRLGAEVVERYRTGAASVDSLLQ